MGGCVVSVMDRQNSSSLVPHPIVLAERAYGKHGVEMVNSPAYSKPASKVYHAADYSSERHSALYNELYNSENIAQSFEKLCQRRSSATAIAYRPVEKVAKETITDASGAQKVMDITHLKATKYMTFNELWNHISGVGRGLVELGLEAGSKVAIYEETRWEWLASIYGIWTQQMIATTVYANLGLDALAYALKETECKAIICNGKQMSQLVTMMLAGDIPKSVIIYFNEKPAELNVGDLQVVAWTQLVESGQKLSHPTRTTSDNNDLALIMYTSGTTGDPKGVMHSFGSLTAGCASLNVRVNDLVGPFEEGETYCCYLPLAHILEFAVVNIMINRGSLIGFGSPRTLTDATTRPHGDFQEYRPVIVIGVPRIFDTLKKAVEAKLPPPGSLKRSVFDHAYQNRLQALKNAKDTPYWNKKVFGTARELLGGRVRLMLSGGGPLSSATQEFISVVFGLLIQGWGLTETVCVGGVQRPGDLQYDIVGQPPPSSEVRLMDTAEYKHTDTPLPRGEILLRGPFLFRGYYKQPELTAEAIDAEGWFHTGDVGAITEKGSLRIIGRVKALAKNVLGEYIAMEALEALYVQNPLCVPNGVCVLVHPQRPYIAALVLTDAAKAAAFAKEHGLSGSLPELLDNPAFHAKAAQSLAATATAAQRKPFECVKFVRVLADEWTPEGGMVTPSLKLKRRVLEEKYADVIAKLFETE